MSHSYLNLEERRRLALLCESRMPVTEIATTLGRHRSTIYRELDTRSRRCLHSGVPFDWMF